VDILRVAAGDGRLTIAELCERVETALSAATVGELADVTADLPGAIRSAPARPWQPAIPAPGAASRWAELQAALMARGTCRGQPSSQRK
jgi:hypothetical protein